jgi:hypothetical protein
MRRFQTLLLTLLALTVSTQAQSVLTDSSAVFHFAADVEKALNPDADKPFSEFFRVSDMDVIYGHFFTVLADSAGVKTFPIEYLMALKGRPKTEYPKYSFKNAQKRGAAPFYVKVEILFERAGNSSSTSSVKIGSGLLSGEKKTQKQKLHMSTRFTVLDATGAKVKEVKARVTSTEPVALKSLDGLDFKAIGKLARGKTEDPKTDNETDPFVTLIKEGAAAIAAQLKQ